MASGRLSERARYALDQHVTIARRRQIEALIHDVGRWPPTETALEHVLNELQELLDLDAGAAHGLAPTTSGWHVEFVHWCGERDAAAARALWEEGLRRAPERPGSYNPTRPEATQRNVAIRPYRTRWYRDQGGASMAEQTLKRGMGLDGTDQLRVLVCDGPVLLGWVGGWRRESFHRRDVLVLQAVVPALRQRMRFERDMPHASVHRAALETALEAFGGPAFLVREDGVIVMVNQRARGLFDEAHFRAYEGLERSLRGEPVPGFHVLAVETSGMPRHQLVIVDESLPEAGLRLRELADRWSLTSRERQVLGLIVEGASNKTVAKQLGVRLRTAEQHVSAVLRKAGMRRRSEVTAVFWSGR